MWAAIKSTGGGAIQRVLRTYMAEFLALYAATLLVYGYFFTHVGFTNHTFPNVWLYHYPTFKTTYEGRWFADILVQLTGGSGVPTVQMALAAALQVVNGLFFARVFRIEGRFAVTMIGALIALHPAFLDYYSFSIDHISFVVGDFLVLVSAWLVSRHCDIVRGGVVPIACFILALATYQPKIALMAFVLIAVQLQAIIADGTQPGLRVAIGYLSRAIALFGASLLGYYATVLLTVRAAGGERQNVNTPIEFVTQTLNAYRKFLEFFLLSVDYLPKFFHYLPVLVIIGAVVAFIRAVRFHAAWQWFAAALLATAVPPALQLSYIINNQTWENSGRILSVHAYFLAFVLILLLRDRVLHNVGRLAGVVVTFFFAIIATQESNAAALREVFDVSKVNRIVSRLEPLLPESRQPASLVVIGELKYSSNRSMRLVPNRTYRAHVRSEPFVHYRQVEIVNFFLGRSTVQSPTPIEIEQAREAARGRQPWPSPESVFAFGRILVVLLEPYADDLKATQSR